MTDSTTAAELLPPGLLAQLGDDALQIRALAAATLSGVHPARGWGGAEEFVDHGSYEPGDDPRRVDWRLEGRTDRLYVKRFRRQAAVRTRIILDASSSMEWRGAEGRPLKSWCARQLVGALALLLSRQGDRCDVVISGMTQVRTPPFAGDAVRAAIHALVSAPSGGSDDGRLALSAALEEPLDLLILVSDLMADAEQLAPLLAAHRSAGRDLILLRVLDPDEINPPFDNATMLVDPEVATTNVLFDRESFERAMELHASSWRALTSRLGARHVLARTDHSLVEPLRQLLALRTR